MLGRQRHRVSGPEEWALEAGIKAQDRGEVRNLGTYRIEKCRSLVKGSERNVEYLLPYSNELATRLESFRLWALAAEEIGLVS